MTSDPFLWTEAVGLGGDLLWLHTFGERFADGRPSALPEGPLVLGAQVTRLPEGAGEIDYDRDTQELRVADGLVTGVRPEVWDFEVSGWPVVPRWLAHRTYRGRGRRSSELDDIRPDRWHSDWTVELLDLLRALHGSVTRQPEQDDLLARICDGPLIPAADLPTPTAAERAVPKTIRRSDDRQRSL